MFEINPLDIRIESSERVLAHDYRAGPLLLLAGPGTGKTYSLLETIKHQITRGYSTQDFFEATLTNAAADDFLKDAKSSISVFFNSSSTLHYRAKGILHRYANELGLHPNFTVVDQYCEELIVRDLASILDMHYSETSEQLKEYREFSAHGEIIDTNFSISYRLLQSFYTALDWYDVVLHACRLLEDNEGIRDTESERFVFLLIDEYQDLNPSDQRFVQLLLNNRSTLLVVGDDDQSIYSSRHADPSGIINFQDRYSNAHILTLPVTSRIPSNIVSASHSLINCNEDRYPKARLIALNETDVRADQGFVVSVNNKSDKAEKQFIYEALATLLNQDISPEEILVLCNCRALGEELIEAILEIDQTMPIKNDLERQYDVSFNDYLLNHIRTFLRDPNNNLSTRLVLNSVSEGPREEESILVKLAFQAGSSLWVAMQRDDLSQHIDNLHPQIMRIAEVYSNLEVELDIDAKTITFVEAFEQLGFLSDYLLINENAGDDARSEAVLEPDDGVRFITIHSSKGLDADFVFIPFLEKS